MSFNFTVPTNALFGAYGLSHRTREDYKYKILSCSCLAKKKQDFSLNEFNLAFLTIYFYEVMITSY